MGLNLYAHGPFVVPETSGGSVVVYSLFIITPIVCECCAFRNAKLPRYEAF